MEAFNEADDELLINLVSQHPLLFDLSVADYKNSKKKDKVWDEIGRVLNKEGDNCKKRWKNIKDTFFHQKRKNKSGTGSAAPKNPRSKFGTYNRLLAFLQLVPNERSTESNIEDTDSTQDGQTSNLEQLSSVSSPEARNIVEHETIEPPTPVFPKSNKKRTRQNKDDILSFLQKREESRQKTLETIANKNVDDPELAMFSDYVKNVLQKLPTNLKIKAKKEIFDVLVKFESLSVEDSTPTQPNSPGLSVHTGLDTSKNTLCTYNVRAYSPISQVSDIDIESEATDLSLIRMLDLTNDDSRYH